MGYIETEENKQKISENLWEHPDTLTYFIDEIIKRAHKKIPWSWVRNWDRKYINVRIDMRDGGFILTNSKGRISLDEFKYQFKDAEESPTPVTAEEKGEE